MADFEDINIGTTANDGTGDKPRTVGQKINTAWAWLKSLQTAIGTAANILLKDGTQTITGAKTFEANTLLKNGTEQIANLNASLLEGIATRPFTTTDYKTAELPPGILRRSHFGIGSSTGVSLAPSSEWDDTAILNMFCRAANSGDSPFGFLGVGFNLSFGTGAQYRRMQILGSVNIATPRLAFRTTTAPATMSGIIDIVHSANTSKIPFIDNADAASAANKGCIRYRESGNNSYAEMCMRTGASTYAWIPIIQNNW